MIQAQRSLSQASQYQPDPPDVTRSDSGVVELVSLARRDQVALARIRIVHGEELDHLPGIAIEGLPDATLENDLVPILKSQDDVRIVRVEVLLAQLLRRRGHLAGGLV